MNNERVREQYLYHVAMAAFFGFVDTVIYNPPEDNAAFYFSFEEDESTLLNRVKASCLGYGFKEIEYLAEHKIEGEKKLYLAIGVTSNA